MKGVLISSDAWTIGSGIVAGCPLKTLIASS